MNYASNSNIREVIKFYNLGDKTFETDFSFSDKYNNPYPLFHPHFILKISDIIKLQVVSFVFESKMRLSSSEFHTYFISDVHSYGTRQSASEDLFQPRRLTTQYGLNTVHYIGATLWNTIDDVIKKSHSLNAFRRELKLFYLDSYA